MTYWLFGNIQPSLGLSGQDSFPSELPWYVVISPLKPFAKISHASENRSSSAEKEGLVTKHSLSGPCKGALEKGYRLKSTGTTLFGGRRRWQ